MLEVVAEKSPYNIRIREKVRVWDVKSLFVYPEFYWNLLKELEKKSSDQRYVYVHVSASGPNGRLAVLGISVDADGYEKGDIHKNLTKQVVPFLAKRKKQLDEILEEYKPPEHLHVFVRKPIGKGSETEEYWLGENMVPYYKKPENL